jgi:hypothetical protein
MRRALERRGSTTAAHATATRAMNIPNSQRLVVEVML